MLSSHSWSTPDAYPRIYEMGGFIAPYAGDSTGFVEKWRRHVEWADPRYYFGLGYGADMNGLGAQGDPRGADVPNPVTYPFEGLGGVTVGRQHAGERVYDINVDGVAQYGLYPDWIEDLQQVAEHSDSDGAVTARRSPPTWRAAPRPTCRPGSGRRASSPTRAATPGCARTPSGFRSRVTEGMTDPPGDAAVGQPYLRQDLTYTYCARTAADPEVRMVVDLDRRGRVAGIRRLP